MKWTLILQTELQSYKLQSNQVVTTKQELT